MKQSSTFSLCLRCVPEQQFLEGRGAHTDTNSYAVTQCEPYPYAREPRQGRVRLRGLAQRSSKRPDFQLSTP